MAKRIQYKELTKLQRDRAILSLAYTYLQFKTCKKCDYPRVDGYCCGHCGACNPDQSYAEEEAWEKKYA